MVENVYYIIVVVWTLFYLFNVFVDLPNLPWSDCDKGSEYFTHPSNVHLSAAVVG